MKVNEIFYSLQGEGANAGTPAIFIRFSGCNLQCPFCDTEHKPGMDVTLEEILVMVERHAKMAARKPLVVLTGGEPTLFPLGVLIHDLHDRGYKIALETNGTRFPGWIQSVDYITLSPKFEFCDNAELKLAECDELKVVYNGQNALGKYDKIVAKKCYLQPCDTGDSLRNVSLIQECIGICKRNPKWNLSLQLQKIAHIR